jgi:hypothetical protein
MRARSSPPILPAGSGLRSGLDGRDVLHLSTTIGLNGSLGEVSKGDPFPVVVEVRSIPGRSIGGVGGDRRGADEQIDVAHGEDEGLITSLWTPLR